jgi:predicted dehydrogenase
MMGAQHAATLATMPGAELLVCCDLDPLAVERLPHGIAFTTVLDRALATPGLDAVVIATPQSHHATAVRAAVDHGLAVLCEKPIADSLDSADAIAELAAVSSRPIVIGHMYRFDPRYRALADAVLGGRLGDVVHLSTRGLTPSYEGRLLAHRTSLAIENAVHGLDVMGWLAGPIERIYAEASRRGVVGAGAVESIVATLAFRSGAVGTLEVDWALPVEAGLANVDNVMVVGTTGIGWIDGRDFGVGVLTANQPPSYPASFTYRGPGGAPQGIYRAEVEHFLRHVRGEGPWPVTIAEARAALAAGLALDASIRTGSAVRLADLESQHPGG